MNPSSRNEYCGIIEGELASAALASQHVRTAHGYPCCDHPGHGTDCELFDRAPPGRYSAAGGLAGDGRLTVFVLFLGTFAMEYRALAASAFATQEIRNERSIGILQAFRSVRRKQLRLFWMIMLASMITGPFGLIVFPLLAFAIAPGFPVAILENTTALAAIKRGGFTCQRWPRQVRVAARTIRSTVVSPARSRSRLLANISDPTVVHDCADLEFFGTAQARRRNCFGGSYLSPLNRCCVLVLSSHDYSGG